MNDEQHYDRWRSAMVDATFVGIGIDWNRVTVDSSMLGFERDGVAMVRAVRQLAGDSVRGARTKSFSNSGYTGLACGRATLGYRGDSAWVELRSAGADELWRYDWYDYAHCTRLDICVDMLVPHEYRRLGDSAMLGYEWFTANHKRNGKWKVPYYQRKGEGETVYIGSRESDHFFRLYNKTVESGWVHPDGNIWRLEIQFNTPLANEVSHGIRRMGNTDRKIFGVFADYCARAAIPIVNASHYKPLVQFRPDSVPTDNQRSLDWLNRSVRGTVTRLTRAGEYDNVVKSLGFLGLDTRDSKE